MIGGKTHAQTPSALGTMLNASTYGMTIPTIIGTTRTSLLAIWAANLRKGGSDKKAKKKGVTTYVENVDFLIGSNPIEAVLQMWSNNTGNYTLDLVKVTVPIPGGGSGIITWVDTNFYYLLGATVNVAPLFTFNDYGNQNYGKLSAGRANVSAGGSGYVVGDTFQINGGGATIPAVGVITVAVGGGAAQGVEIVSGGAGYTSFIGLTTTALSGVGSGLTVNVILGTGGNVSVVTEYPLWNAWNPGPDATQMTGLSRYPWTYHWKPSDGTNLYLCPGLGVYPQTTGAPSPGAGNINVYYYKLNKSTKFHPPITYNRMQWEASLGSGTEYSDAGFSSQQIIYPWYAGVGSSKMDLGAAGMLPDWRVEIKGSHARWPTGDADFTDMIEDTVKSGVLQTAAQLGLIQRGVNCNEMPGPVQGRMVANLEPMSFNGADHGTLFYPCANRAGSKLIAVSRWALDSGSNPTISDTAGNTWNPVLLVAPYFGFWYATSVGGAAGNLVTPVYNGLSFSYDQNFYIYEMDPSLDTVEASNTAHGTAAVDNFILNVSVTVTKPSWIMAVLDVNSAPVNTYFPPVHWTSIIPDVRDPNLLPNTYQPVICKRYVNTPGTYTFTMNLLTHVTYNCVVFALSASSPSPLPKALGNILDDASLVQTRLQCQANGLYGSVAMQGAKKASDWLDEFYQCANAAPVWSGFKLKSIPWSEVSYYGNGAVYAAPTASGPVANLRESDLIGTDTLVTVERKAQTDTNNVLQIQHVDRFNSYVQATVSEPEAGPIALFGPRKQSPKQLLEIQDPAIARKLLGIAVRREAYLRNTYKFTAKAKWIGLEAMDLVTINDAKVGINALPVRLTSVQETPTHELQCEAQDFVYGLNAPEANLTATTPTPNGYDAGTVPGPVNTPIIFEAPLRMSGLGMAALVFGELWFAISDSDPTYGGCFVYVSTDGGTSYKQIGTNIGNATTGVLTADFPPSLGSIITATLNAGGTGYAVNDTFNITGGGGALGTGKVLTAPGGVVATFAIVDHGNGYSVTTGAATVHTSGSGTGLTLNLTVVSTVSDPDAANTLSVNLTESNGGDLGGLLNYTQQDRDAFVAPAYVQAANGPTPSLTGTQYGDFEGIDNMVSFGGSPKLCKFTFPALTAGQSTYIAMCWFGQIAFFHGAGGTVYCYENNLGYFDWSASDPRSMPIPFAPGIGRSNVIYESGNGSSSFAYNFAAIGIVVNNTAFSLLGLPLLSKVTVQQVSGSGTLTATMSGKTYTKTGLTNANVMMVQINPVTPGNPPLLLVFAQNVSGTDVADGWTFNFNPPDNTPGFPPGTYLGFSLSSQNGSTPVAGNNYELISYMTANLTSANNYTIVPTTRRGVFGTPITDHAVNSRFAMLENWMQPMDSQTGSAPTMPGVFRTLFDGSWIGKTLYFKFVPFNQSLGGVGDLASATAYPYVISGLGSGVNDSGNAPTGTGVGPGSGGGTPGAPNQAQYTISGGALTQPTPTTINMAPATAVFGSSTASYQTRTFTIPTPAAATQYYVTIYDPGQTGDGTVLLDAQCQTSNAYVGVPGYVYIGSITALPGGGSTQTGAGGWPPAEQISVNGV